MSDGWSDRKRRSICNFLVNSPKGSVFLSSIDTSEISKTADKVLEMLDAIVEKVGEENVVQVVTDNVANYKAAGEKLMEKRTKLFWTPCAAHCIDLMLEDFDKKIKVHSVTIAKARKITTYIYSRTILLTWMKEFTKDRELIRPGVTRFATSYLTLRCLNEHKGSLLALFSSNKWISTLPLVKVLRIVDSDENPAMGFIYELMAQAKNQIKENFNNVERNYKPILDIVDERWENQLHKPLHAAAYFLNPQFQYKPDFQANADIKIGLYNCLQRMVSDPDERMMIDLQMDAFKNAKELFGLPTVVMTRTKKTPADWWDSYGDECPELKNFAIRILSLTCSSSGYERNWSAFEMRRHEKRASKPITQPIVLEEFSSDDEWIAEVEEPVLPTNDAWFTNLERATRRFAREATRNGDEIHEDHDDEIDEVTNLSDNDDEIAATYIGSNEFNDDDEFGDGSKFENEPASTGGTDVRSDDVDYGNLSFGYDD
uniref:DUF659 domain-containing protein n=1 Tax=Chenopodium quinoa TaxID=63459 RepID=A0A803KPS5_CHEQI